MTDRSDSWFDLSGAVQADAFHASKLLVMGPQGVGESVAIAFRKKLTDQISYFLLNPSLAVQLGWLLIGVASEYIEAEGLEEGMFTDEDEDEE